MWEQEGRDSAACQDLEAFREALKAPDSIDNNAWDLLTLLESHNNDAGLEVLFYSLRASYAFLDHCCMLIEKHLHKHIDMFSLVLRGSVSSATALRTTADIDVDVAFPRSVERLRPENVDAKAQ
ncbi:hypothetical protein HDU86_004375, partial [Geranomyces michiganensis]